MYSVAERDGFRSAGATGRSRNYAEALRFLPRTALRAPGAGIVAFTFLAEKSKQLGAFLSLLTLTGARVSLRKMAGFFLPGPAYWNNCQRSLRTPDIEQSLIIRS